jgi:hypothetical protein
LQGEKGGVNGGQVGGQEARPQPVDEVDAQEEGKEIDQVPGRGVVHPPQSLECEFERPAEQEIGRAVEFVVVRAAAIDAFVEFVPAPVGALNRFGVVVEKRFVPREAVVAEGKQPGQEQGCEQEQDGQAGIHSRV